MLQNKLTTNKRSAYKYKNRNVSVIYQENIVMILMKLHRYFGELLIIGR